MIESLTVRDFQKHRKRTFEFSPSITTLVGHTESGKSTLLRCLRWIALNRVRGRIIHWDATSTKGTLVVDGEKIVRLKSKKSNLYRLDGRKFKAFATKVPDPVVKLLNVSELNFQSQRDKDFWFSLSPGQVSKELNSIINLESIDSSLAYVAAIVRKTKASIDVNRDRLKEARERRDTMRWVMEADESLQRVEHARKKHDDLDERSTQLVELVEHLEKATAAVDRLDRASILASKALRAGRTLQTTSKRYTRLNELIEGVQRSRKASQIVLPDIDRLTTITMKGEMVKLQIERLSTLIQEIDQSQETIDACSKRLHVCQHKFHKRMKGKCPLCGK